MALQLLGYPDQARERTQEALTLAQELAHLTEIFRTLFNMPDASRRIPAAGV